MADIAINPVSRRVQFTGNTGTGPFAFTFNILADEDIVVYKNTTLLTITTDYTVSTNADGTGSVTLVAALVSSDVLTIIGGRELERTTDFVTAGDLLAESLNEQLDSLVIMAQQLDEKMTRSFKVNPGDQFTDLEMPLLDDRKGRFLQFNTTTGDPEAGPSNTSISNIADYITEIDTVGDDLNAGSFTAGSEYDFGSITEASVGSTGSPDGFIVTVYNNLSDITNVAGISSNVTTVSGISSDVTSVAGNNANVTTVAGNISNVNSVAGNATNINAVASNATNINAVAADATDIGTVATNIANVNSVGGISANVTTVAGISSDITAVAADATDIGTVATNIADVNTVGSISANVTTVAGISSDVTAVAADATDIGIVSTNIADVNTAATNITEIQNASTNAATATTKAAEAATSASNAATSETNASTSATNASTSASNAASSATSASNAQSAAEAASDSALASFDSFDDRYLGTKTSDPSVDNDGNALAAGALYFNTTSSAMKVYTGSAWVAAYVSGTDYLALSGGTMTGDINLGDSVKAQFGAGSDLQIYHDGSHSYVDENGTGQLKIRSNGTGVLLQTVDGENLATFANNAAVNLYYDNAAKLATTSNGIDVTGNVNADSITLNDNNIAYFGTGNDLRIYHDGNHSFIQDSGTGSLRLLGQDIHIQNATGTEYMIQAANDGAVTLYHDGVATLNTFAGGVSVTGSLNADGLSLGDGEYANFGNSNDLQIYHNGSDSIIADTGTGNLKLLGNDMRINNADSSQSYFSATNGGSAIAYHNGNAKLTTTTNGISVTGSITASGNITAYSDERLKTNIKTIEGAVDTVKALRGVTFEKDGKGSLGVIAQEVQKVLPELVHEDDEYLSVAYGNMVGLLVEAIKELKAEIEELKHGSTK